MPDTGAPTDRKSRTNLDFYHSPTQLRFDTWNRLEEYTSRLAEKHMRKADVAALTKKTREAMTLLQTIEDYTAFPSQEDFKLLWQLYEQQDFDLLSRGLPPSASMPLSRVSRCRSKISSRASACNCSIAHPPASSRPFRVTVSMPA